LRKIKKEVEQYMTALTTEGQTHTSRFRFPEDFVGFQGHFPDKKILPGVCQLQAALTTLEKANKQAVELKEIMSAKYFSPVLPGEELTCVCSHVPEKESTITVKAVMFKNEAKIAEFKLRIRFTEAQ
jgi:3-hydroxyacyl-[acyl-carrier-protein] dehydratase